MNEMPMQEAYIRGREAAKGKALPKDLIAIPSKTDYETPADYAYAVGYADARNEAFSLEAEVA